MKFNAAAARAFANSLGYLDGAGPEVRFWLHNAIDAAEAAQQDANRYRWLRDKNSSHVHSSAWINSVTAKKDTGVDILDANEVPALIDAEIDKRMSSDAPLIAELLLGPTPEEWKEFERAGQQHEWDSEGCCTNCGFDGAEWQHWKQNTHEGRAQPQAKMPRCKEV